MELNVLFSRMASSEIPLELRGPAVEFLVAREIAFRLQLPSSKVDNVRLFYGTNHTPVAKEMVSSVNEQYPLDVHSTIELVYRIWFHRYDLCHSSSTFRRYDSFTTEIAPRYLEVYNRWTADPLLDGLSATIWAFLNDRFGKQV